MSELEKTISDLGRAFEAFKAENDARIKQVEANGHADPLLAEKVDKINAEISQIAAMKKQLEVIDTAVARGQLPGGAKAEIDRVKAEHKAGFEKWVRRGNEQGLKELEVKAGVSTLDDTAGGFLVPEEIDKNIDRVASTMSAMRRLATIITIGTASYKKLVNKGGTTSGWVGEKGTRTETSTPSLAEIEIPTKEIYANPAITQASLDDSFMDVSAWLANEVAIEFNEEEGAAFITGTGVSSPKGIAAYTTITNGSYSWGKIGHIAGGHATLLNDVDKIIDLQHALKAVYRNGASFLMNDLTLATVRKIKDGEGNYIWRPGLEQGSPDTLLGKPVEIDDNVADIGGSALAMFFANFKRAYLIVDRVGTRVLRDPYTNKPYVMFYTTKRVGGAIVNYEAIKVLKIYTS